MPNALTALDFPRASTTRTARLVMLADADLPAVFEATDKLSSRGQKETALRTASYLSLLVVAAAGGALDWQVRGGTVDVGGLLSLTAFAAALVLGLSTAARKPEQQWYLGRAAAESVKTLAWRYAVGGDPFTKSSSDADRVFTERLSELVAQTRDLDWPAVADMEQITAAMRSIRASSLVDRRRAYEVGRIEQQFSWYSSKAQSSSKRGNLWAGAAVSATALGATFGVVRALGIVSVDLLGVLAATAASANAWVQLRQYRTLSSSYAVAAQELGLVKATLARTRSEGDWARAVSDAEDAISREHTLWLARRSRAGDRMAPASLQSLASPRRETEGEQ